MRVMLDSGLESNVKLSTVGCSHDVILAFRYTYFNHRKSVSDEATPLSNFFASVCVS